MTRPYEHLHREIAALRVQVEELQEELRFAREEQQQAVKHQAQGDLQKLGLQGWMCEALELFLSQSFVSREKLIRLAEARNWSSAHTYPGKVMFHIRQGLAPLGIRIETHWGRGYKVSRENQMKLRELMSNTEQFLEAH